MKRIAMMLVLLCSLCACGSAAEPSGPEDQGGTRFDTDCITVYECGGDAWDITDPLVIADIVGAADMDRWVAQKDPKDQLSAVPTYVLDFNNGTCVAPLGDGYILLGSGCVHEADRFGVTGGCQYQVNTAFTDQIGAALGG